MLNPTGKITMKENEIPIIPADVPAYAKGIRIVIEGES